MYRFRLEAAQGMVEYALILVLVSVVCIGVLTALGSSVGDVFDTVLEALDSTGDEDSSDNDDGSSTDDENTGDSNSPGDGGGNNPPPDNGGGDTGGDNPPPDDGGGDTGGDDPPPDNGDGDTGGDNPPPDDGGGSTGGDNPPPDDGGDTGDNENEQDEEETPPAPSPPVARDDSASVFQGESVTINLVANDIEGSSPINPTTVMIVKSPSSGSVATSGNGSVTYTADSDFDGTATFTYIVQDADGQASEAATVTVEVKELGPECDGNGQLPECYVKSISPGDGSRGVTGNTIVIQYNQPMKSSGTGRVNATGSYMVYQTGNTGKSVSIQSATYNPSSYTVTLVLNTSDRDWRSGIWYTIRVKSSVRNINNQSQGENVETNFQTAP